MHNVNMNMTYDPVADAAFLTLVGSVGFGEVTAGDVLDLDLENASITVDFDAKGKPLGVEVLGASRVFLPAFLDAVQRQQTR